MSIRKYLAWPATLSMELGKRIGSHNSGALTFLYSAYPFSWREKSGGLRDDFAKQAWAFFQKNPNKPFFRYTNYKGKRVLRYATADLMRPNCVSCHNSHADTPKVGWKSGDVRGVLEVIHPLENVMASTQQNSQHMFIILFFYSLTGVSFIIYVLNRNRKQAKFLKQQVELRTMELQGANSELEKTLVRQVEAEEELKLHQEHLEELIDERTSELVSEKERAEIASKAKSMFLANMSHEVRTPLNGILGSLQLLTRTSLEDKQKRFVTISHKSATSLLKVINDILDFSKIEAGHLSIEKISFNLKHEIDSVFELLLAPAAERGIQLKKSYSCMVPARVIGDPTRVRQVFSNLMNNAIKFTQSGGDVTVDVAFDLENDENGMLQVKVSDRGIGMSATAMGKIFDSFSQAEESTTRKYGGTGLGLAICKELVGLMGGKLHAQSTEGIGSTFSFAIPVSFETDCLHDDNVTDNSLTDNLMQEKRSMSVLVVEDNPINQMIAHELLEDMVTRVDLADNGEAAIKKIADNHYDLVFMDCQMPVMDGFAATQHVRKQESLSSSEKSPLVIIALTANAYKSDQDKCMAAGMNDYLAKPFDVDDMEKMLDKYSS